ncbi:MAG TPA: triose-phosphate isomerase, partial [Candidatus Limnocylindrales bacterium]
MREVVIAANWKMHTTPADAGDLARTIAARTREPGVTRVICPPFVCLAAVRDALAEADPDVAVGAQNLHHELAGAYTGEVSAPMLDGLATWVIVGHSERRRDAGETDAVIAQKVGRALDAGLRPILCVGERLADREASRATDVVDAQVRGALADIAAERARAGGLVVAYE